MHDALTSGRRLDRAGIVAAGSWLVDRNKAVSHWPQEETVAEILEERHEGGGCGFNCGIDLKKLGARYPVHAFGLIGTDAEGAYLIETAKAQGLDVTGLHVTTEARTSTTDVMSSVKTGKRTFFHAQGAHAIMGPEHLDVAGLNARLLHLGLPGLHRRLDGKCGAEANGWVDVLAAARRAGMLTNMELVSIAPERLKAVVAPCLPHLDLLIVNDHEIGALVDHETVESGETMIEACRTAARAVMRLGPMGWVAVHFPGGAILIGRDGTEAFQPSVAVPPSEVVGANGAGDAFAAGFLHAFHEGAAPGDALALAHAAAAASLRAITTTGSVDTAEACLALAARWGWRS